MIDVKIIENNGLVALCTVTGSDDDFHEDLARIKSIPFKDRDFVMNTEPKYWRVRNAQQYANLVVEIGDAIRVHKIQIRMF